jgi:shikimate dehydrogenase
LFGKNSDGQGALDALRAAGLDPVGARVLVLGSGGAARAIAMTLAIDAPPERMSVLGVVPEELDRLIADLSARRTGQIDGAVLTPESARAELGNADIVLQCTPVGMHPNVDQSPIDVSLLPPRVAVFDAVYNPKKTRLLQAAELIGCTVVPGLEMFVRQAAVQFELLTGQRAPLDVIRQALEELL